MRYSYISQENALILASASPRRKQLLEQAGLPFRAVTSHVTEDNLCEDPIQTACLLAEKKACEISARIRDYWTLGADTIVVVNHLNSDAVSKNPPGVALVLGKPEDAADAAYMLHLLSGTEHRVITGFCILNPSGQPVHTEAISTRVSIKNLTNQEIDAYIKTNEPFGKAGSYAIQGIGSFMVKGISGSYTNVVGLPLYAVIKALISVGALESFPVTFE